MLLLSESNSLEWNRINMLMDHKKERLKGKINFTNILCTTFPTYKKTQN